jgi:hypothetical protein
MAAEEIFDGPRKDVVDARTSVRRWRAFEEHEPRRVFSRRERLSEKILFLPPREQLALDPAGRSAGSGW